MNAELVSTGLGVLIGLGITGAYGLTSTAIRKRVTVRSPEGRAIDQIVPAVNALLESQGPMLHGTIAIMEALKGQCNGNVDDALKINREAKQKFDAFLVESARVEAAK